MTRILRLVIGLRFACRWNLRPHNDRRLRKGEVPGLAMPESAYRVCDSCGRVRRVKVRKTKET